MATIGTLKVQIKAMTDGELMTQVNGVGHSQALAYEHACKADKIGMGAFVVFSKGNKWARGYDILSRQLQRLNTELNKRMTGYCRECGGEMPIDGYICNDCKELSNMPLIDGEIMGDE